MARILLLWAGLLSVVHSEQECPTADDSSLIQVKSHVAGAKPDGSEPDDQESANWIASGSIEPGSEYSCKEFDVRNVAQCKNKCRPEECQFYTIKPKDDRHSICRVCDGFGEGSRFIPEKGWETFASCGDDLEKCVEDAKGMLKK